MQEKKKRTLSLVFALLAAVIFGMSFMFSKLALEVAKPTVLLAFRFITAFAAMSLVIGVNALVGKLRGRPLFAFSLKGKPIGSLILLGLIQPVLYFFCENYGILYTSSAVAGTIIAVVPIACILMDVLVLHEKVTRRQVVCAVLCIIGVAFIYMGGETRNADYTLEENTLTMTIDGQEVGTGTLDNGVLTLDFLGMTCVFEKPAEAQ